MTWEVAVQARAGALSLDVTLSGDRHPVALVGPNGSGKTTLLRVIAGAHRPARGQVVVSGVTLLHSERGIDLPSERRRVGYVPQGYGLFPHLSVAENVGFGLSTGPTRRPRAQRRTTALAVLETLGCRHLADRLPHHLSGGEQQRVALARAMAIQPAMLLLDEPLAALDASARRGVRRALVEHLDALDRPSLVVTHDVRDVLALGAEVCVLDRGHIVQRGAVDELRLAPANDFVAEFVGA